MRIFIAANQEGGQIQQLTGPGFAVMPSALTQGTLVDERRCAPRRPAGATRPARRGRQPRPGAGDGRGARRHGRVERADRRAGPASSAPTRPTNGEHGAAFIQRDGRGRGHDGGQALPRARPGDREHRLHRPTWSTTSPRRTIPYLELVPRGDGAGVPYRDGGRWPPTRRSTRTQLAVFSPTVMKRLRSGRDRARLQRRDRLRRPGRRRRRAVDPGGVAGDLVPRPRAVT